MAYVIIHGDACHLPLAAVSVDAVVTDPPYGLEFMGREWDGAGGFRRSLNPADVGRDSVFGRSSRTSPEYRTGKPANARIRTREDQRTNPAEGKSTTSTPEAYVAGPLYQQWCQAWAAEALRVLKPGGHLLAFGGTRTVHRLTCGIEDAGFEIRDGIDWLYGQGFPKSLDVAKAVTATQNHGGANSVRIRQARLGQEYVPTGRAGNRDGVGGPAANRLGDDPTREVVTELTEDARRWAGWGTALKPAHEPIVVARKPLAGTVAANVLTYNTGALNIDACRIDTTEPISAHHGTANRRTSMGNGWHDPYKPGDAGSVMQTSGRWPTNVVLTHAGNDVDGDLCAGGCVPGCPVAELDAQSGDRPGFSSQNDRGFVKTGLYGAGFGDIPAGRREGYNDTGGASRFFPVFRYEAKADSAERPRADGVAHPTVKPLELMRWLVRLVTPPGGLVLDQFAGSGTTAEACALEGLRYVCLEREAAYLPLITARLSKPLQPVLFAGEG